MIYRNDKTGLIPAILTKWFQQRVEYRNLAKKFSDEGDIEKFIAEGFGRKGGYVFRDGSGISNNVKRKKTFLDILSEIPDGKGT